MAMSNGFAVVPSGLYPGQIVHIDGGYHRIKSIIPRQGKNNAGKYVVTYVRGKLKSVELQMGQWVGTKYRG